MLEWWVHQKLNFITRQNSYEDLHHPQTGGVFITGVNISSSLNRPSCNGEPLLKIQHLVQWH
ncbi:MAG: hypothetical protein JWR61_2961 [Ferruginibacter sp.]|jgi:hypothetical protein|nr:hypothetical protein [Ferruginibacter sp.]